MTDETRFYHVIISRELHVYATSADEAMDMAVKTEQYANRKVTAEIMEPLPNEATPI